MRVILRPLALSDIEEAAAWYENKQPGLREKFFAEVFDTIAKVAEHPHIYQRVHLDIRRAPLHRFPYGIFYIEIQPEIHVIAVTHDRRHPSRWKRRR